MHWPDCSRAGRATTARSWPPNLPRDGECRSTGRGGAREAARRRRAAARRVPAQRRRARVVPSGRPAAAAPPLAGQAAARGRAGRAARAGSLPAALAGRRRAANRHRPAGRGDRPARGHAAAGVSVLERDVLPARVAGYSPRLLDELGAAGEVVWVGLGSLGKDDGRVALYQARPTAAAAARRRCAGDRPDADGAWLRDVIREHLRNRGASFYRDILAAAMTAAVARGERAPSRARTARRAVGPCVGHGSDQRHVRATARAALAAQRHPAGARARRPRAKPRFASDRADGSARGGRTLVAGQ